MPFGWSVQDPGPGTFARLIGTSRDTVGLCPGFRGREILELGRVGVLTPLKAVCEGAMNCCRLLYSDGESGGIDTFLKTMLHSRSSPEKTVGLFQWTKTWTLEGILLVSEAADKQRTVVVPERSWRRLSTEHGIRPPYGYGFDTKDSVVVLESFPRRGYLYLV